jgi:CheY-like chemotaxis protein
MEPIEVILLIDDNETSCYLAERAIKKGQVADQVVTVHSGWGALEILKELSVNHKKLPEIILLDLNMPGMDGFEFLEELAKQQHINLSHTRIFILTSSAHPQDKKKAAAAPVCVSGFLTKPLTQESLSFFLQ